MCTLVFILALLAPPSSAAGVTVTRLDGNSLSGELRGWKEQQLLIATPEGEQTVPTDELVSLRWPAAQQTGPPPTAAPAVVELIDGTTLPAGHIAISGSRLSLTPAVEGATGEKPLSIPIRQVAAVRLQALTPTAASQWDEIREQNIASDVLLVLKRGGESVDHVEGVVGDVTPDKIEFKLDGESVRIDRKKVAGFLFFRRDEQAQPDPRCILHGRSGLRASAADVRLDDTLLHVTTLAGVELEWPLADVEFADFSAGKIRYLSDIEQSTARWTPLVALPADASLAAAYGEPRYDQSAFGGPLTLSAGELAASASSAQTRSFAKGLAIRSRTELAYRLPAGFRRFVATAGIEPATAATGNVQLTIFGDDRLLLDANVAGDQSPRDIELDITDIKRLKIVVDFGRNLDTGDWLNLCDARLMK